MSLTDTKIRNAKAKEKLYKLSDGQGLQLFVNPNGSKYWRYAYRFNDKQKTLAIDVYPDVSLAKAREQHAEARKLLQEGIDPMEDRKAQQRAQAIARLNTFRLVAEAWYEHWQPSVSEKHAKQVWRRIELDILPEIGEAPITELTTGSFKELVKKIENRGAIDIAKRNLQKCSQIMRYAVAHDLVPNNPVADIRPSDILKKRKKRNYPRIPLTELPQLLRDIDDYAGSEVTVLALKMMTYTFVRTSELIKARWEEFDFEAKRWNLSAERMKMDRPHIVPLAEQVIEILDELKKYDNGSGFVFPPDTVGRGEHMSNNTILYALYRMGYRGRMCGHGFRGVASTALHEQGYNHAHIELQLAHSENDDDVSKAYNYAEYLPQRTAMMQEWADYLDAIKERRIIQLPTKIA